jgi:competence protein ComEC
MALLLSPLLAPPRVPPTGVARVSVFDAGRGSLVLIVTHSHVLLFDTGDSWNTRGSRMAYGVFPALDRLSRGRVDVLVLPALNADRAHGTALLATERRVGRVIVGGGMPATSLPASRCRDERFTWDGVTFDLLAAGPGGRYCVLRLSSGGHVVFAGGDLDADAEADLLSRLPRQALASDVAILGRQASSLGSTRRWIEATVTEGAGTLVIASGGVEGSDSRALALTRWRDAGARVLDTQRDGAVEFDFGTDGVSKLAVASSARWPFAWRRD